jgi:hypothetical protein
MQYMCRNVLERGKATVCDAEVDVCEETEWEDSLD